MPVNVDAFGKAWDAATITDTEPLQVGRRVTVVDVLRMAQEEAARVRAEHAAEIAELRAIIMRQQAELAQMQPVTGECTPGHRVDWRGYAGGL